MILLIKLTLFLSAYVLSDIPDQWGFLWKNSKRNWSNSGNGIY